MKLLLAVVTVLTLLTACGPSQTEREALYAYTDQQALTVCAGASTVQGIDVSVYQGTIDWAQVHAAGKQFAIARVANGLSTDTKFATNWPAIKSNGMVRGAYQYFQPSLDALAQADLVVATVGMLGVGDLPVTCDVEAGGTLPTPAAYNAMLHTWATRVEAGTGKKPMIYTGRYYWTPNVDTTDFASNALWHPQYTTAACPNINDRWTTWKFWQYRADPVGSLPGGTVAGISGYVDLDVFNGSLADLQALAGQTGCTPGCDGTSTVSATCARVDCATSGQTCANDAQGLRCVSPACPATGQHDVCLDDARLAHCSNGVQAAPTDCSATMQRCSTANAPTGARCVSTYCAASMTTPPVAAVTCYPTAPVRVATCDANGALTLKACAAGEACSTVGGAHCEPAVACTVDTCVGNQVSHCVGGQTTTTVDCAASNNVCTTAGGPARCVARDCVADVTQPPVAHTTCLSTGWLASCGADGLVAHAEPCAAGLTCAVSGGQAACAGGTPQTDGGSTVVPGEDGGVVRERLALEGGGCAQAPGVLLLGLAVLTLARRRRAR